MIEKEYTKKLGIVIKQRNIISLICIILFILLCTLIFLLTNKSKTIVLVPSHLQSEMRISSDGMASKSYIEQFTRDIAYTMLNITPNSIKYSNKTILSITSPKLHKDLSHQFSLYQEDVINKNISTYFALQNIKFNDESNLLVSFEGELITFIGKNIVSKEIKEYFLKFKLNGTKLSLIGFQEIEDKENKGGNNGK